MIRRLFAIAAAVSLAVFVLGACVWLWSHIRTQALIHSVPGREVHWWLGEGRLRIVEVTWSPAAAEAQTGWSFESPSPRPDRGRFVPGAGASRAWAVDARSYGAGYLLGFAAFPAAWLLWTRTRGVDPAACSVCGYDLRGTPSTRTCPDCGASVV